jgi:hypothetical protein
MYMGAWAWSRLGSVNPYPGGAPIPSPEEARTETTALAVAVWAFESRISRITVCAPAAEYACCAVNALEYGVSHCPSPSQSQRAWRVALESVSEEEDASNVTVSSTFGKTGEWVKRAVGPDAVTVTAIGAVWTREPLVPVTVTV